MPASPSGAGRDGDGPTYGTTYYVYYDDPSGRGLVSYAATTTLTDAFSSPTNPARHYVGASPCPPPPGVQHNGHARLSAGVWMIRIERKPGLWEVGRPSGMRPGPLWGSYAGSGGIHGGPAHRPALAAEHGGFFFTRLDALGLVMELHTLFTPEGWGREVLTAAKAACHVVFRGRCQVMTTMEWPTTRAPSRPGPSGSRRRASFKKRRWARPASGRLPDLIGEASPAFGRQIMPLAAIGGFLASAGGAAAIWRQWGPSPAPPWPPAPTKGGERANRRRQHQ